MSRPRIAFTAVILAAQRAGATDPLAIEAGVPNKSLAPIGGAPLIRHVVDALRATPGMGRLRIVVEPSSARLIRQALPSGCPADFIDAADNLADSVYAAVRGVAGPVVVTTSDNVLLTPGAVDAMRDALADGADVAVALSTREAVLAAHPEGQRRFYRFTDGAYSNCNLYGFSGPGAARAAESFRSGGQFAKKPMRLALALGPINLVLFLAKRLSLRGAIRRVAKRFGLRVEPVILADGAHAIDVDNSRTYRCAEFVMLQRRAASALAAE